MEKDCREYLSYLTAEINGSMGIVFANWDNTSGVEDFELDLGQSNEGGCSAAISTISSFEMTQYGSTEKIPDEEPESESEMSEESEMTEE